MTTDGEIARFHATITADIAGLTRSVAAARSQIAGLGSHTSQTAGQMGSAWRSLAQGFGVGLGFAGITAVTRALTDGVRATMSYETAFVGVKRTVDATDAQFQVLDSTIRRMATESLPLTRDALAGIATIGGQMNIGVEDMPKFIDTVARTSVAAPALSPEAAALSLGNLAGKGLLDIPISELDHLSSAILKTADSSRSSEPQIVDFAQRIAGAGKLVGLTNAEILGLSATLPGLGINAEMGGTAISQSLLTMSEIVQKGGADLSLLAMIAGVSGAEFKRVWEQDAAQAFQMFLSGVQMGGQAIAPAFDELGFGGARATQTLLALANDTAEWQRQTAIANDELINGNALLIESEKAFGTAASQVQLFKSQITELSDAITGPLISALIEVLPHMINFIELATKTPTAIGMAQPQDWFESFQSVLERAGLPSDANFGLGGQSAKERAEANQKHLDDEARDRYSRTINNEGPIGPVSASVAAERERLSKVQWNDPDLEAALGGSARDDMDIAAPDKNKVTPEVQDFRNRIAANLAARDASTKKEAAPKLSDEQKQLNQIEEAHTRELVEAYIKGGDKRVSVVRAEQARLDAAWGGIAQGLHDKLGVAVPEEFRLMWEAAQKETKDKGKATLDGLLGFLAARDTEHGANPLSNKFKMGEGTQYIVNGDVNVGLRPDIPGGVDVNAAITVADRVDYTQVR